ncbi:hypothetical protein HMI55_004026 [Coelomomyces lativittatus]|nr:hypothetical protein HMI56_006030 [Coelomomyces lativittatus]KAJ1500143.1 hypothetical protein HMI55_004026 [Coelomomyces lativittatus]
MTIPQLLAHPFIQNIHVCQPGVQANHHEHVVPQATAEALAAMQSTTATHPC